MRETLARVEDGVWKLEMAQESKGRSKREMGYVGLKSGVRTKRRREWRRQTRGRRWGLSVGNQKYKIYKWFGGEWKLAVADFSLQCSDREN